MSSLLVPVDITPVIVPVVTPLTNDPGTSGRVRNMPCVPQSMPACLTKLQNGAYVVKAEHANKGYVLLKDLYIAERNPEGWAKYERYLAAWAAGTARMSFPFEDLPKEVQIRQTNSIVDDEFAGEFVALKVKQTTGATAAPTKSKG